MIEQCFRRFLHFSTILSVLFAWGCGSNAPKLPADKADKAVEQFLDAWSRNEPLDKFADPNHPIQGTDSDWSAGCRLLSFLNVEAKQSQETPDHVRCRVALSLRDRQGKQWDKEVMYDVQLGEKIVISRAAP